MIWVAFQGSTPKNGFRNGEAREDAPESGLRRTGNPFNPRLPVAKRGWRIVVPVVGSGHRDTLRRSGQVSERLKERHWKCRVRFFRTVGSNPTLSA